MEFDRFNQVDFFNLIRSKLPPERSMANEVMLAAGFDRRTYNRKINNSSPLTVHEFFAIYTKFFKIIGGHEMHFLTLKYRYEYSKVSHTKYTLFRQEEDILHAMDFLLKHHDACSYYAATELPIFYMLAYPELAAVHFYDLKRNYLMSKHYIDKPFDLVTEKNTPEVLIGKQIADKYLQAQAVEVWSDSTLDSVLETLNEMKEEGVFVKPAHYKQIKAALHECVEHIHQMAKTGMRCMCKNTDNIYPESPFKATFQLYKKAMRHMQHNALFHADDLYRSYTFNNGLHIVMQNEAGICKETLATYHALMKRGTLLSVTNTKDRNAFFKLLHAKIDNALK